MARLTKAHLNVVSCVSSDLYKTITTIVFVLDLRQYFHVTSEKIEGSLRRFKDLNELYFNDHIPLKISPSFTQALFGLNLRVFSAPYTSLPSNFLAKISTGWPSLERLDLSGNKVTLKVLNSLAKLTTLRTLDLSAALGDVAVDRVAGPLNKLTSLVSLSLAGNRLTDFDCNLGLSALKNLRALNVSETFIKPDFSKLPISDLTFANFVPAPRPILVPDSLHTLDCDIGTFYAMPSGNVETLCVRKQNDAVDDLLSMTERDSVRVLELRQFKIQINVFLSGVSFLIKRMPNVESLLFDLVWDDTIGKFDENLHRLFTLVKVFEQIRTLSVRIDISTLQKDSMALIWQGLISVIIQQRTQVLLSQYNAAICIVLREGCPSTGKSLICRYLNGRRWWTTKRFLRPDELVPIPGAYNPRSQRKK